MIISIIMISIAREIIDKNSYNSENKEGLGVGLKDELSSSSQGTGEGKG